jgi:hypothetical protein
MNQTAVTYFNGLGGSEENHKNSSRQLVGIRTGYLQNESQTYDVNIAIQLNCPFIQPTSTDKFVCDGKIYGKIIIPAFFFLSRLALKVTHTVTRFRPTNSSTAALRVVGGDEKGTQ